MRRILITSEAEKEIEFDPSALPTATLETGSRIVLHGSQVHRVTHAGDRLLVNGKRCAWPWPIRETGGATPTVTGDSGRREIRAAMPGKVVKVLVAVSQSVEPAEGLLILEAMKMQNEVRSHGTGRVATIHVAEGDTVASGQVLVTLE